MLAVISAALCLPKWVWFKHSGSGQIINEDVFQLFEWTFCFLFFDIRRSSS